MALKAKPLRDKKCKACKQPFTPRRALQVCCGVECALTIAHKQKEKRRRLEHRLNKERIKPRKKWISDLQREFNAYIRARDTNQPCISCGTFTGQRHAGHYRAVGAGGASPLRFNEINVHGQCAQCNKWRSASIDYRLGLVDRIGPELVEWLEKDHPPLKLTIEQIRALLKYYRKARRDILVYDAGTTPF